jgi:hypothetical protein
MVVLGMKLIGEQGGKRPDIHMQDGYAEVTVPWPDAKVAVTFDLIIIHFLTKVMRVNNRTKQTGTEKGKYVTIIRDEIK